MFRIFFLSVLGLITFEGVGFSQTVDTVKLTNPSFEGNPLEGGQFNSLPKGWIDCGFRGETAPDVHPVLGGNFSVIKAPSHGKTYIGMVVRDNDTWERISQKLSKSVEKGKCYTFTIDAARSETYLSQSRITDSSANYVAPAKLRIYGGNEYCDRAELLGESSLIRNTKWLKFNFTFEPAGNHSYIILEAFYNTPALYPYNGNILIDNASHIVRIPCDGEDPLVAAAEVPATQPKKEPRRTTSPSIVNVYPNSRPATNPKILESLDIAKIRQGQTIRIDKLFFDANSFDIPSASHPVLNEIFDFMRTNVNVVIEIGGHTNTIPPHRFCDELSTKRAKSVAFYLRDKGITGRRLLYKGYGKRNPLTEDTSQEGRKENQRVEIKILKV